MRSSSEILKCAKEHGLAQLSAEESNVFYILTADTWICMEGLAGFVTSDDRYMIPKYIDGLNAIGSNLLAGDFKLLYQKLSSLPEWSDRNALSDIVFGEGEIGDLVDEIYSKYYNQYDDWGNKLVKYNPEVVD